MYKIIEGSKEDRETVVATFPAIATLSPAFREKAITAWVSAWRSSPYDTFPDMPYALFAPDYGTAKHVNEVTRFGLMLARAASEEWGYEYDHDIMASILLLHDIDKPLIYSRTPDGACLSEFGRQMPHGVVGGMILKDLDFPLPVIATVATHAADAPFHGENFEAYILYYADMFSGDNITREVGMRAFYQPRKG